MRTGGFFDPKQLCRRARQLKAGVAAAQRLGLELPRPMANPRGS
jgi:hypothetical protein